MTFAPARIDCTLVGWKGVEKLRRKRSSSRTYKRQSTVLRPADRPVSTRPSRAPQLLRAVGGSQLRITVVNSATPKCWTLPRTSAIQAGTVQWSSITPTRNRGLFDVIAGYRAVSVVLIFATTGAACSRSESRLMNSSCSVPMDSCGLGFKLP